MTGLKPQVVREWNSLRQYDILFLVAIIAPLQPYTGRIQDLENLEAFPEKFGVVGLRGCEVLEVLDEDGVVISETNPFERKRGKRQKEGKTEKERKIERVCVCVCVVGRER